MELKTFSNAIFVLLASIFHIRAITAATHASSVNCTTNSFSIPSWFIEEFRSSPARVSFLVYNRASGTAHGLQCDQKTATSSTWGCRPPGNLPSDPSLETSLQIQPNSAVIQVQQSWACDDRNPAKPLKFMASGKTTIPLSCANNSCKSSNPVDLIRGTLQSPVSGITPAYAEGPDGHDKPGCLAASKNPQWTLGTVIFLNETGDDEFAFQSQSIQFQITNHATGYVAGCLNYFSAGPGEDPAVQINCGGGVDFTRRNRYSITTQAVFYPRSWRFGINQTWFCDDVDAAKPMTISATGAANLSLNCTKDSSTTTACQTPSALVRGSVVTQAELVPYSIEDPLPTPDGCTVSSVLSPAWILSNFAVEKSASSASNGKTQPATISFNIRHDTKVNLFDSPFFVSRYDVDLQSAEAWYACRFGPGEVPLAPKNCSFRYNSQENKLAIKADWLCADIDAEHPVLFSGISTTTLPKLECTVGPTGSSVCETRFGHSWTSGVSDVGWQTLDAVP